MTTYEGRLRAADWEVRPTTLAVAQNLVEKFHYARGGANTGVYFHGLFLRGESYCGGVVWWMPPTRVAAESVNREHWRKVLTLTRMVVMPIVPKNACSFMLARSVRLIRNDGRFVSLVTYADDSVGHEGRVYRAAGWTYMGTSKGDPKWVDAEGRQVARQATKTRTAAQMRDLGYRTVGVARKHKFVLHLK